MSWEIAALQGHLKDLRRMRDGYASGEIRSAYNAVCDRLDVLISKLSEDDHEK